MLLSLIRTGTGETLLRHTRHLKGRNLGPVFQCTLDRRSNWSPINFGSWSEINSEHQVNRRSVDRRSKLIWLAIEKPALSNDAVVATTDSSCNDCQTLRHLLTNAILVSFCPFAFATQKSRQTLRTRSTRKRPRCVDALDGWVSWARGSRLCVTLIDVHVTHGRVGTLCPTRVTETLVVRLQTQDLRLLEIN